MNAISKMLRDLLTGRDGVSHDLGRWSWLCSLLAIAGAGIWNAIHGITFDLVQVATALGIVAGAHGGALAMKARTEPNEEKKETK